MGNVHMEATQINYREGDKKMSVAQAIKNAGNTGLAHTADIAPDFSAESAYNAGDLVYHNGTLYVFTSNHSAGAWSADDTQAVTVGGEITSLMSCLTNAPLYVIATDDIVLGSGASGNVTFSKSSFTIPSGYTANWGACIYSAVGGWGIGCNSQAAFDSGEPHFTDSNNLVVSITSGSSAGNVTFRVTAAVQITANQ